MKHGHDATYNFQFLNEVDLFYVRTVTSISVKCIKLANVSNVSSGKFEISMIYCHRHSS